jgi:hypothetical protein
LNNNRLFVVATPKEPADASRELLSYPPAERQPYPALAVVTDNRRAKVWARAVGPCFVVNVDGLGDFIDVRYNFIHVVTWDFSQASLSLSLPKEGM